MKTGNWAASYCAYGCKRLSAAFLHQAANVAEEPIAKVAAHLQQAIDVDVQWAQSAANQTNC
jgi:hypothetical protein